MATLRICLLGRPQISRGDHQVSSALSEKAVALLAYLLAGPARGCTREELAGLFWGETDEEHANYYVRRTLWALRKALNPSGAAADSYIRFEGDHYFFQTDSDYWVDLSDFQRILAPFTGSPRASSPSHPDLPLSGHEPAVLEQGLQLYRGRFLEGLQLRDCVEFMDWLDFKRDQLERLYVDGLRALAQEKTILADLYGAISVYEQILALEPLDEDVLGNLMVAYYNVGARDKALERYRFFHRALRQQFGLEPLPETRKLYMDVRNGTLTSSQSYSLPLSQLRPGLGANAIPLIGRASEEAQLNDALEQAVQSNGCLAIVAGEAGIGKTRLVEEFMRRVSVFPLTLISARCYAQERNLPYQPVIDALRAYLPRADYKHLRCLSPLWLGEVAKLLPELNDCLPRDWSCPVLHPDQERNRLFEALAQFIAHLSQRKPVVLFLDDLHAADEPSFDLIHYLARRLVASRVLLVGSLRVEALADRPSLAHLLSELERDSRLIKITLARLSEAGTTELVRRVLGARENLEELAHRLHAETSGNPFFLVEMLKVYREEPEPGSDEGRLPASVREVIRHRLELLDEQSRHLLALAAVIGRQFDSDILRQVQGGDEQSLLTTLEWLIFRGWIADVPGSPPGRYDFSHGLVREVVYQMLRPDRCRSLHRLVGLALERKAAEEDELAGALAHHFLMGGEYEKSLRYSLRAAARASRLYAHNEAIIHYRRALSIVKSGRARMPRTDLLEVNCQLAGAHEFRGEYEAAIAVNEAVLAELSPTDPYFRRINFQLAVVYDRRGQYDHAMACLRAMQAAIPIVPEPANRLDAAMAARGMAMVHLHREQSQMALTYCTRALELLDGENRPAEDTQIATTLAAERVAVYEIMANCHYHLANYASAAIYYQQALEIAREREWRRSIPHLLRGLGEVARRTGDYRAAGEHVLRSLAICEEIGDTAGVVASHGALGNLSYNCGDFDQSIAHFSSALEVCRRIGDRHGIADYCLSLAFVQLDQGRVDEAEANLQEALRIGQEIDAALVLTRAGYHLARVARARQQWAEAEAKVLETIAAARQSGLRMMEAMGHRLLGEILSQRGRITEARAEMLMSLGLFREQRDRFEMAWTLRSYARFLAMRGNIAGARVRLKRSAAMFEALGATRESTITNKELARMEMPSNETPLETAP